MALEKMKGERAIKALKPGAGRRSHQRREWSVSRPLCMGPAIMGVWTTPLRQTETKQHRLHHASRTQACLWCAGAWLDVPPIEIC
jgi:hypothetical protein